VFWHFISSFAHNKFTIVPSALRGKLERMCSREWITQGNYPASQNVLYAGHCSSIYRGRYNFAWNYKCVCKAGTYGLQIMRGQYHLLLLLIFYLCFLVLSWWSRHLHFIYAMLQRYFSVEAPTTLKDIMKINS
jgi:hypothetical protein